MPKDVMRVIMAGNDGTSLVLEMRRTLRSMMTIGIGAALEGDGDGDGNGNGNGDGDDDVEVKLKRCIHAKAMEDKG